MRSVETGAEAARVPPHDLDAERAVIGAMLVSETAIAVVAERLAAEDFYSEVHRIIYGAMMRLYSRGEPIDQLTLTNELRSVNEFERIGGRPYVFQIVESVPTAANAGRYADIVRGKALLRAIIDVGSRITEDAFREPEDVSEALDSAEQLIYGSWALVHGHNPFLTDYVLAPGERRRLCALGRRLPAARLRRAETGRGRHSA